MYLHWLSPGEKKKTVRFTAEEGREDGEALLIVISRDAAGRSTPEGSCVIAVDSRTEKGDETEP